MDDLIAPDYLSKATDVIVRYELASLNGEAFHEYLIKLSEKLKHEIHSSHGSDIHLFNINQATKEWSVAYDESCFEAGNLGQQLHFLLETCQLEADIPINILDIEWTKHLLSEFEGPQQGINEIQRHFAIYDRPLLSGLLGSGIKLSGKELIEEAYHMWMGGCDMVSERRSLKNVSSSEFEDRISFITKEMTNCSKRTGKRKEYIPQISGSSYESILLKIQKAEKHGISMISLDEEMIGLAGLRSISQQFGKRGMVILSSGLRKKHFSQKVGLDCSRLIGSDIFRLDHLLTQDRKNIVDEVNKDRAFEHAKSMPFIHIDDQFINIEQSIKNLGHHLIIESNRLIKNHPDGIKEGSSALLSAIEAAARGVEQKKAAKDHLPLKKALETELRDLESHQGESLSMS
jgi:ribulose 1,5-bisphosphate carboxylase large subunit-like protein